MISVRHFILRARQALQKSDSGAITMAETLIVLSIGITLLAVWAHGRLNQMEVDNARTAGRAIATFSRAAAVWLAEAPPTTSGIYTISELQECTDENGLRFLSCSFSSTTPIPYASTNTGDPITFGDLEINVTIAAAGSLGIIDFGVFRDGRDSNGDGVPDSRPDLAAAAFQTASRETGAGVLEFFELLFAEPDASTIIFDQEDPNYNLSKVENLARLRARVGSLTSGNAPFLRIDGGNEMTGALNFENGMQVDMSGNSLIVEGPGDVEVNTESGDLVVSGQLETNSLVATSAEIDALEVEPENGVTGTGFDRFDQAPDIIRIDENITDLSERVRVNETNIETNSDAIAANVLEIGKNFADIFELTGRVSTNTLNIAENRNLIDQNSRNILNLSDNESEICTPSRATVIANNPGRLSCGGECFACGSWRGVSAAYTYRTRNLETLACDDHTIRIYSSCCLQSNGLCDGWCQYGANLC